MSQKKQGKAIKKPIVAPKRPKANPKTPKRAWAANSGLVISTVLLTVAQCSSVIGIQHAAQAAVTVFSTIERVMANKEDFQIIADDAADLILAIWRLQEKSEIPKKWTSEITKMVGDLKTVLDKVNTIANRQASRNIVVRVIFNMTDAGRIRQTREMINSATTKFQVLSHIKMNELLLEVATRQQALSQDMKHLQADDTARAEEDEDEDEAGEEGDGEEGEEPSYLPPNRAPRPFPAVASPVAIHGFSFSNGSGHMYNSNVGNIINNNISNVGNNNSRNYYG